MKESKFTKIMVEIDGKSVVDITDLPKDQYEEFLEIIHRLRCAYAIINRSIDILGKKFN